MPYIKQEERKKVDNLIDEITKVLKGSEPNDRKGMLNYVFTRIACGAFDIPKDIRYWKINDIVGTLECIKMEFYERIAKKFELTKIDINGDVPEYKQEDYEKRAEER
jgi:hypothetical protein